MAWSPHARVVFGGALNDLGLLGSDIWQCTVNVVPLDMVEGWCDPYLAAIQAPLKTWFTAVASEMSTNADLRFIKANLIGADGHYSNPTVTHRFDYTSIGVGAKAPTMPGYLSLAMSWSTALTRGPGSKGRIYPPNAPTAAGSGQSVANSTSTNNAMNAAKALLTVLASTTTTQATPVIASGVNAAVTPITGVRCGNLIDVQRRRRNSINETYVAAAWP